MRHRMKLLPWLYTLVLGCAGDIDEVSSALGAHSGWAVPELTMTSVSLEAGEGSLTFRATLEAPIVLASLELKSPYQDYWWMFGIDSAPGNIPGWPRTPHIGPPVEFQVFARWDGREMTAWLADRRPLENGDPAIIRPLAAPIVDGNGISVTFDPCLLGVDSFIYFGFGMEWVYSPFERTWDGGDGTRLGLAGNETLTHGPFPPPDFFDAVACIPE